MTKVNPQNTATARLAEASRNPVRAALAEGASAIDVENALLDLDGISDLLADMAVALKSGHDLSSRSLSFLSSAIRDRARTLADDLGMEVFHPGGEG